MTDPEPPPDDDAGTRARTLLALGFVLLLVLGALILVHFLRDQSHLEDCLMQGRSNCAPVGSSSSN